MSVSHLLLSLLFLLLHLHSILAFSTASPQVVVAFAAFLAYGTCSLSLSLSLFLFLCFCVPCFAFCFNYLHKAFYTLCGYKMYADCCCCNKNNCSIRLQNVNKGSHLGFCHSPRSLCSGRLFANECYR